MNLAYAFVDPDATDGLQVDIIGKRVDCSVLGAAPYDPDMAIPRS